ncbi:nucleoside hydrolase [Allomuricauda sp. SCSIO 65647]|uniref:nucleoside hydrolase n=1 Tax=Allomuricauda sp. SCSIO 65647 TaxID=2908843 RepID=UPI001F2150B9|nr:nucleoside hydrolase [Muricauda sp. SCSIO 65647]UJH67816.1 nucleoside hydrolase [Muricauda sp. SCSIO 65647]
MKRKFIIDTDTASDDAVALIMAVNSPDIEIMAVTVVAGNVSLDQGVQNALYTLSLCNSDLSVYPGIAKPLVRPLKTADHVHGKDGMGDIGLPLSGFEPEEEHAVDVLLNMINEHIGEVTLVCMAPLTNIATALLLDPSIAQKVKECVVMGGVGKGRGNVTPVSEYNFWADPEAAKIVFESGMPIKMVGWDISRKYAVFDKTAVERIRAIGTSLAHFSVDIQKTLVEYAQTLSHLEGFDLPDPMTMAIAIDPAIATKTKKAYVTVLQNDDWSRGQTVIDYVGTTGCPSNAEIVLEADSDRFMNMLHDFLNKI